MKLTIAITGVEKIRGLEDASKKIIKDSLEKQARCLLYKAWRRRERVDPDPVAVNSYNPKEYAGEADAIKDGQAYSGILVGADKGVFSQAQPDRANAAKWLDDEHPSNRVKISALAATAYSNSFSDYIKKHENYSVRFSRQLKAELPAILGEAQAGIAKLSELGELAIDAGGKLENAFREIVRQGDSKLRNAQSAPIRFASITPRYPGEDTKRAPIENDLHVCKIERNWLTWSTALRFLGDWRFSDNITVIEYCPHCGGLLPTLQLHEVNAE